MPSIHPPLEFRLESWSAFRKALPSGFLEPGWDTPRAADDPTAVELEFKTDEEDEEHQPSSSSRSRETATVRVVPYKDEYGDDSGDERQQSVSWNTVTTHGEQRAARYRRTPTGRHLQACSLLPPS